MNQKNEIIEFLMKDKVNNVNIINFIESYPIDYIEKIGESVLVKGTSDRHWVYISSKSEAELKIIKSRLDKEDTAFAVVEDWMLPILTEGRAVKWKMSTMRLILPDEIAVAEPKNTMSGLKTSDAEFLYENSEYKDVISIEYITERIENGISSCISYMDKPIAWGMTQDDGAIGFLHVMPEHRKKGYARDIMADLIKKVRSKNKIPFAHIEEENERSFSLATGLGFRKDKAVSWFEIE